MSSEELWDIYDRDRNNTGRTIARKSNELLEKDEFHLVVHTCVFNSKGEMLIQQRQKTKNGWPNLWDFSAGGSAIKGETSQGAIHRELLEELGIDYDFSNLRPQFTINFTKGFDDFYLIKKDVNLNELNFQEEEVQDAKWATKEEIINLIENDKFIPYYNSYINFVFDMSYDNENVDTRKMNKNRKKQ